MEKHFEQQTTQKMLCTSVYALATRPSNVFSIPDLLHQTTDTH